MIEELLEALEALDFDEKILAKIANIDEDDLGLYLRKNKKKLQQRRLGVLYQIVVLHKKKLLIFITRIK